MNIYYLKFNVKPTRENDKYDLVEGAFAHCWINEASPQNALIKAEFFVSKDDWKVTGVKDCPIEVSESDFSGKDLEMERFLKARSEGISIAYTGWSRDGKTTAGPFQSVQTYKFPISEYIDNKRKLSQKGRCLHYENGCRCNEIIKAHSIQKSQSLSAIAQDGHVYKISSDIGSLKNNKGRLTYRKYGINNVSTFLGFCKKHDNELFEPIDNGLLIPTDQQILLYSYRSLCRELFVSENALALIKGQIEKGVNQYAIKNVLSEYAIGKAFGLKNMSRHKSEYDKSLRNKSYSDIRYVVFQSKQKPTIAFSGVYYPDFDFLGRQLQNLGDQSRDLQLITFCSAPIEKGWAYIFAWHQTSSNVCVEFMRSLAAKVYNDATSLGDALFRLAVTNCENLAISPVWWDALAQDNKDKIANRAIYGADILSVIDETYLVNGLEGISAWEFEKVISNMD